MQHGCVIIILEVLFPSADLGTMIGSSSYQKSVVYARPRSAIENQRDLKTASKGKSKGGEG